MANELSLPLFLLSVVVVSLSGVMMPGPVTAVTVAKGHQSSRAGAWIALGHGAIELPLIAAIYLGLGQVFQSAAVGAAIGLLGGAMMLYLAWRLFLSVRQATPEARPLPYNSVAAGIVATAANPGFFLWWATVGAALVLSARAFGAMGIVALTISHWLCDIGWDWLLSWSVFKSRRLWSQQVKQAVFVGCGLLLAGFGGWFIFSAISFVVG